MADVLPADPKSGDRLAPGVRLGRYELLLPVARGGMARVWAARQHGQRGFNKLVAVKTILPHLRREAQFERMFVNEARVASFIQHPNCCQIVELGEEGDILYMAMEWITGDSLARALKVSGKAVPMDPRIIARVVADACAGLHAAHQQTDELGRPLHIVHRDVSPHNIMTGADGTVKVCDFGVAKALGSLQEATLAGQIKGKLNYMSPEQFMGAPLDARADVFAIGVVIYEATTGRQPFEGENDLMVMQNLARGVFNPPSHVVHNYPRELEQIVVRAMQSERERRFDTAEQLRMALEEWLARSGPIVTQSHVAAAVRERIGNIIDARRDQIAKASQGGKGEGAAWPEVPGHTPSNLGAAPAQAAGPPGMPGAGALGPPNAPPVGNSKSGVRNAQNPLLTTMPLQSSTVQQAIHLAMLQATAAAHAQAHPTSQVPGQPAQYAGQQGSQVHSPFGPPITQPPQGHMPAGNTMPPSSGTGQWWEGSAPPPQQPGAAGMAGPYSGVSQGPGTITGSGPLSLGLMSSPMSGPMSAQQTALTSPPKGGAGYYTLAITIGLVLAFVIGGGAWVAWRYSRTTPLTDPTGAKIDAAPTTRTAPTGTMTGTTSTATTAAATGAAPSAAPTIMPPIELPPATPAATDTPPANGGGGNAGTSNTGSNNGGTSTSGGTGTGGTSGGAPSSTATSRPKPKPTALPDNPY